MPGVKVWQQYQTGHVVYMDSDAKVVMDRANAELPTISATRPWRMMPVIVFVDDGGNPTIYRMGWSIGRWDQD